MKKLPSLWVPMMPDGTLLYDRACPRKSTSKDFWGKNSGIVEVEYVPRKTRKVRSR